MSKPTDDELTPESCWRPILNALQLPAFGTDPCCHPQASVPAVRRYFGEHHGHVDGLTATWHGIPWVQPPYSSPAKWVGRAAVYQNAVALITGDTSTRMWEQIIWPRAMAIVFWYGRIQFYSPHNPERKTGAKRSSALVIFGDIVKDWAPLEAVGRIIVP